MNWPNKEGGLLMPGNLELPFKPFTLDEVCRIANVKGPVLDRLMNTSATGRGLNLVRGDDGWSTGLDYMQTFAVFVANKWLEEGSGWERADDVVEYLSTMKVEFLDKELSEGRTFPVPNAMG